MKFARVAFYGACQFAGVFSAFYAVFMAATSPTSWLRRFMPH